MEDPKIKTKIVHSKSADAWNIIGISLGKKHKIAVFPYLKNNEFTKDEAFRHAEYISHCFNHSDIICNSISSIKKRKDTTYSNR